MSQFILSPDGRLLLAGGMILATPPAAPAAPMTSLALVDWYYTASGTAPRFNIQTTAASGDTTANVPIVFTYSGGAPSKLEARIVGAGGAPVAGFDWTDITASVQVDGAGNGVGYLDGVPAGIAYKREIRQVSAGGTLSDVDAVAFNVGPMLLLWGQSNMRGTLEGNISGGGTVPGTALTEATFYSTNGTGAFFGKAGFIGSSNSVTIGSYATHWGGGLSILRHVGNLLQAKFGRKVGVAMNPYAQNGTAMSGFMNSAGVIPMLADAGSTPPGIGFSSPARIISGDYRLVSWHQGESEAGATTGRAPRLADLIKFCQGHIAQVAKFGRPANKLTFLFAIMGVYNTTSAKHAEALRGAVLDLVAYGATQGWDVRIGWNCIDLDPVASSDSLHFGGDDMRRSNRRLLQGILNTLDPVAVPYGARGPRLSGAYSRAGNDVTFTVEHEGGAALAAKNSGAAITGWYANTLADFSGTDLAVSNVTILSGTQVRITVAGAPSTFYVKHCGGKVDTLQSYYPNVSNLIFDDFVYPTGAHASEQFTGLPLLPTPDAIKVG